MTAGEAAISGFSIRLPTRMATKVSKGEEKPVDREKEKQQRVNRFNRASLIYDDYAESYRKVACRLLMQLDRHGGPPPRRILDVGCGTGHMTQLILEAFPEAEVVALDIADRMVRATCEKVGDDRSRLQVVVGDVEEVDLSELGPFGLIVCNAVCHWFREPLKTFGRLADNLETGGRLLASIYGPENCAELGALFGQVEEEWNLPREQHLFPTRSSKEWEELLTAAGLVKIDSWESWMRLEYANGLSFLKAIKAVGEAAGRTSHPLWLQRRILLEVIRRYERAHRCGNGVYATMHFLQFLFEKTDDPSEVMLFK
jgi:malonyl-CoA O-methyltransferase